MEARGFRFISLSVYRSLNNFVCLQLYTTWLPGSTVFSPQKGLFGPGTTGATDFARLSTNEIEYRNPARFLFVLVKTKWLS